MYGYWKLDAAAGAGAERGLMKVESQAKGGPL
jgi:hypothetical protein